MTQYIIKKLLLMIPLLIGLTLIVFLILHLAPGDPVDLMVGPNVTPEVYENVRNKLGLDKPLYVQYFTFLKNVLRGDLGTSILKNVPVKDLIAERFPITLKLGVLSLLVSFAIAIPIGIQAAKYRNTPVDYLSMTFALVGISIPTFGFGLTLLYIFAYKLRWFPVSGHDTLLHLVLPVFTVGLTDAAVTARMVRSSMLEVMGEDYIRTARSKGLSEKVVMNKHALKNALISVITLLGMRMGWILGGSAILETVFSIPGLGRLMVDGIFSRDYPVVQGSMLVLGVSVLVGNLIADILYALVDPRIKY
ncbi:MAG: ABC transporter permease [Clostridiales bacterium]|nr:ABC transporter permease [Clostridiales bacterium]